MTVTTSDSRPQASQEASSLERTQSGDTTSNSSHRADSDHDGVVPEARPNTQTVDDVDPEPGEQPEVLRVTSSNRPYTIFAPHQKAIIVLISTLGSAFSPFTANIYLPAIDTISHALNVSVSKVNLTITTYMIFQGIAPSFISAVADEHGRRPAYVIGFALYMAANLGLGLNNSYAGLLVLRCLQSSGSSGLTTLNQGTIADIITSAERGKYIAITSLSGILAPSVAPIVGGVLAQQLGWHSIFWFLLIASGVYFIPLLLFFPETSRNIVGDGSIRPPAWNRCLTDVIRNRKRRDVEEADEKPDSLPENKKKQKHHLHIFASFRVIADPETALILVTIGIVYACFYAISTSLTVQLGRLYNLSPTLQGLLFLPQCVGTIFAAIFNSKIVDMRFNHHAKRIGLPVDKSKQINILTSAMPIERARLEIVIPMLIVSALATLVYGWLIEAKVSIAGPIVMLVIIGFTALSSFSIMNVLVIDLNRKRSASAAAANNLVRCLLGAGASAVVNPVIDGIGNGWCFTITALLCLLCIPLLLACIKYGPQLRTKRHEKEQRKADAGAL